MEAVAERARFAGRANPGDADGGGHDAGGASSAAGIGRVTLVRLESGEPSLRHATLVAIAQALRRPVEADVDPAWSNKLVRLERAVVDWPTATNKRLQSN
ncbi:MAG: hypothetical protein E6J43_13485 [Chloroflexi bacterium]|nr:MAG: hypothetical protein E6J43_13485 [Chloroflexota bacterium]